MSVWRNGIIFFAVINSADIYASAADAINVFIICAIVNIGPLSFGFGSFSDRNICAPAMFLSLDSSRNPASVCAANIISLFLKSMPSLGYVATQSKSFSIDAAVFYVAADCWAPIAPSATRSLLLTALTT